MRALPPRSAPQCIDLEIGPGIADGRGDGDLPCQVINDVGVADNCLDGALVMYVALYETATDRSGVGSAARLGCLAPRACERIEDSDPDAIPQQAGGDGIQQTRPLLSQVLSG